MALNKNKVIAAAQRHAQRGQFDRAISELRSIVEEDPDDVRVWHRIADLQIRKGSVAQAIATYKRIANYYSERGFFLKGVAVYKQILNADPTLVEAHEKLGDLYVKLGLGPEAIAQFQIVVGTHEREGRHQESLALLKKIVELGPDDESNRIRLAEGYARQSENQAAIDEFTATLHQLRDKRRLDEYVQVAERLLYLYPDELDVVRALSEVYLERGDAKRALARLQVLFRADPSDPGTLALLARAFTDIGQTAKAISVYRELARVHGDAGNAAGRSEAWAMLLNLDPDDPEALEATGGLPQVDAPATVSGGFPATTAPTGDQIDQLLVDVDLLLKYALKDHARERLDKVFEIDPYHEGALLKKRDMALADERTDDAIEALYTLSEGAEQAGERQKAMGWLGEIIQIRPGDAEAAERMKRVSSGMARQLASSAEPVDAGTGGDDYDVDLGELDFDGSVDLQPAAAGAGFDLDLGDLDGSVEDEFADLLSDEPPAPIITPAPPGGAIVPPPPEDDFGDLLADDPAPADDEFGDLLGGSSVPADDEFGDLLGGTPAPADDAFGDLLADEPPPADDAFGDLLASDGPAPVQPADDEFGDLLADEPAPAVDDEFGALIVDPPAPAVDDEFGALIVDPPAPVADEDDFGGLIVDPPAPADEDEFGDLLADEPAPADDDEFGDLLADEPAPADDDEFGDLLADDPAPADEDEFGDLLDDAPAPPVELAHEADDDLGDLVITPPAPEDPAPVADDFDDLLADGGTPVAFDEDLVAATAPADDLDALQLDPAPAAPADDVVIIPPASTPGPADDGAEFMSEVSSPQGLPDEDEFADLLLDPSGAGDETDFGVYRSADDVPLAADEGLRLSPVSGAPSEIDIDIDVSENMPEVDLDFPEPDPEPEPEPAPDELQLPPPPPPSHRRRPIPRAADAELPPPPPPPKPAPPAVDDLDDDIEELDLDEVDIIELDDDDLLLEDDSLDESADSLDDSGDSLDASGDSLDDSGGSLDDLDLVDGDAAVIAAPPAEETARIEDDELADLDLDGGSPDVGPSLFGAVDQADLGDVTLSSPPAVPEAETPAEEPPTVDAIPSIMLDDPTVDGAAQDDALILSPPVDVAADGDALLAGDDIDDLATASLDVPVEHEPDEDADVELSEPNAAPELDAAAEHDATPEPDASPELDATPETDAAPELDAAAETDAASEVDETPDVEATADPGEVPDADPEPVDVANATDAGDIESVDAAGQDDSADAEPAEAPRSVPVPRAPARPTPPSPPGRAPLPRPPTFDRVNSLRVASGMPSAPRPLSAGLSLNTLRGSMPTPPRPAASGIGAMPGAPRPPAPPAATPPTPAAPAPESLISPPAPSVEDAEDTVAVDTTMLANMLDEGPSVDLPAEDRTEAGDLSIDPPALLDPVEPEPEPEAAQPVDLSEELAELDFLIESGLHDDARELLREYQDKHPGHPELDARSSRLEGSNSLFGDVDEDDLLSGFTDDLDFDLGDVRGAELSELQEDDGDTHFDLGLAFKEMGQYKKAISELELAARRPERRAEALRIMALCHLEQGNAELAVSTLGDALDTANLPLAARSGLQYDLAGAYEQLGQLDQARAQLEAIVAAGMDDFLDVRDRLRKLQS